MRAGNARRESEVFVCMDARGMRERSVVTQSMMSPYGLNGIAGGSVNGCNGRLEARGGEHVNAKRGGKSDLDFDAWP